MADKSWLDSDPERTARKAECLGPIKAAVAAKAAMAQTDLPCEGRIQGKVRDIYDLPNGNLLLCATDRQSAFDRFSPTDTPQIFPRDPCAFALFRARPLCFPSSFGHICPDVMTGHDIADKHHTRPPRASNTLPS